MAGRAVRTHISENPIKEGNYFLVEPTFEVLGSKTLNFVQQLRMFNNNKK